MFQKNSSPDAKKQNKLPAPDQEPLKIHVNQADLPLRLRTTSALEDKKPEADPPLSNDAAPQPGGSEAIEAEAFNILRNRAACKAKAKAGPNAKPSMSPAGATKATKGMKRPAAKTMVENMIEYHVPMPDAKWEGRTKESWTSGHYQKCRKHAIAQGMTDDDAKANARIACAKALQKWNQWMGQ